MLGIVIANWNGHKIIGTCLESLINQSYQNFKVYIVDNGSQDESIDIINEFKDKLDLQLTKLEENKGFATANNIGIKNAIKDKCKYILTLNNDTEVDKDCLKNAINTIENNKEYGVFQLLMLNFYERNICDAAGINFDENLIPILEGYKKNLSEVDLNKEISGACAGAAIYKTELLEKYSLDNNEYFDESFFAYYEDVDLALRLKRAGVKTLLIKNAIVYHIHSATSTKSSGFKEYYILRNLMYYTKRHISPELYAKKRKVYLTIYAKNIVKNITNIKVLKSIRKAFSDSVEGSKKIYYLDIKKKED